MIWDNFSIFRRIAPSPAAHVRTCCEDFLWMLHGKNGIRNSQNRLCLYAFMAVGTLPKYLRGKLLQFEWRQYQI